MVFEKWFLNSMEDDLWFCLEMVSLILKIVNCSIFRLTYTCTIWPALICNTNLFLNTRIHSIYLQFVSCVYSILFLFHLLLFYSTVQREIKYWRIYWFNWADHGKLTKSNCICCGIFSFLYLYNKALPSYIHILYIC